MTEIARENTSLERQLRNQIKDLLAALENIETQCDDVMGDWQLVEYAHLPIRYSSIWTLREIARVAIASVKGSMP